MIDLPGDCALVAVKACAELSQSGVECRALAVTYRKRPVNRHIIVVFVFEGRLRGYDREGSMTLPRGLTFASSPTRIAKAWANHVSNPFPFKALEGAWY